MFLFLLCLLIFSLIMVVLYLSVKSTRDESREYQDELNDLYTQMQTGKISIQTYNQLRSGLEQKYHKSQRDRGGL